MAFSLGHLFRAAGKGLASYRRGQSEAKLHQRALEQAQLEYALRLAPEQRRQSETAALDQYLRGQEGGQDLAGRGLNPSVQMGLYTARLRERRAQQPSGSEAHTRARQAELDLRANAQAEAEYIARSNVNPSAVGIYTALRAKPVYEKLEDEILRRIAREAVTQTLRRTSGPDLSGAVQRAAEALGVPKP